TILFMAGSIAKQVLQWGHGSVAVENVAWTRFAPGSIVLQWGHGSVAVENGTFPGSPSRPKTDFNGATARSPWRTTRPSSSSPTAGPLQWGHGSVAVENEDVLAAMDQEYVRLQWGHGSVAVENSPDFRSASP